MAQFVAQVAKLQNAAEFLRIQRAHAPNPILRSLYCIRNLLFVLAVCLLTGCWEKIEYRGTFPENAKSNQVAAEPTAAIEPPSQQPEPAQAAREFDSAKFNSPPTIPSESNIETPPTEVPASDPAALPVSATVGAISPPASIGTKRAAWVLGSKFSLAALANDRGAVPEDVPKWFAEAQAMAEALNIALAALPARPSTAQSDTPSREVLGYIVEQEKAIGPQLAKAHGDEHDALFRLAVRTNLLRVLNTPGSKAVETLSASITDLGPRSGLPIKFWQPLLDVLTNEAASADIRTAVPRMHANVEQHLAAQQNPHE
jgi:hypothetical protein